MAMKKENTISLHPIRNNWYVEKEFKFQVETASEYTGKVVTKPFLLTSLAKYSCRAGVNFLVLKRDKEKFLEYLRLAHISGTWHWKGMMSSDPQLIQIPNGSDFEINGVKSNSDVDFGSWLEGIYIAMILRDINAVKVYGEADPEKVVRYGQNTPDPWEIPFIKFLNGIWAFDTNIVTYLKDALRGSDPTGYNPMRADWMLNILSPLLELWAMVFGKDEARFNAKLLEQQQLRRDWHEALGEEAGNSIMEYIDLAALAAVCYAHDKGFKIDVKSDYLPEFLINGDFPKLEWPDPEWKEWP